MILDNRPEFLEELARGDLDYPERLTVEMTSYCNLRCWMCPKTAGFVNTTPNRLIGEEIMEKVEELLPHVEILQLSGLWGEVFLHPEVYLKMLKMAKEAGCEVRTISNGTLLVSEISERLVDLGLDNLTISIDAATSKTYQAIRVGGDFKTLVKNLKKLYKIKKRKNSSKPDVQLAFVGMKRNIMELPELVKLASKLGVKNVILQGMGEYEDTEGESLTYHHREFGKSIYEKAMVIGQKKGVNVTLFPPDQFDEVSVHAEPVRGSLEEEWEIPKGYRKACDVPWKEAVITTTGDVLTCCAAQRPVGNILQTPFHEIWTSHAYREFRKQVVSKHPPLMCVTCTGVGWRKESVLKDYLKMGETDGQLGLGWYHLEANPAWERTYRWSKKNASFFLENSRGRKNLVLEMRMAGVPKTGEILVNGKKVGTFDFKESKWEKVYFSLPDDAVEKDLVKVELKVHNPSREGTDRRKTLGVALSEAVLE